MAIGRPSWRTDGWRNGLELWSITHFPGLWAFLRRVPLVRSAVNRVIINRLVYKMRTRPEALSTMAP